MFPDSSSWSPKTADVDSRLNAVWEYYGNVPGAADTLNLMNDGRIVILDSSGITRFMNPSTGVWTLGPTRPTATLPHHARRLRDGRIMCVGTSAYDAFCYVLDASGNSWTTVTSIPTGRSLFSMGLLDNDSMAVFGGWNLSYVNSAYSWSPSTNTWTALAGCPRNSLDVRGCGLDDGRVISASGYSMPAGAYVYTRSTNSYVSYNTAINDYGSASSSGITFALANNRALIVPCTTNTITIFDGNTNTFTYGPMVPHAGSNGGGCRASWTDPDLYFMSCSGRLYLGRFVPFN